MEPARCVPRHRGAVATIPAAGPSPWRASDAYTPPASHPSRDRGIRRRRVRRLVGASLSAVGNAVDQSGSGRSAAGGAPAPAASAAAGLVDGSGSTPGDGSEPAAAIDDAKIIRTGAMALEVKDVPTAIRTARDGIIGLGGYIGASTTGTQADRPTATITYRIPADGGSRPSTSPFAGRPDHKVVTEHTEPSR